MKIWFWFRDVLDIRECKKILRSVLDRNQDETESLRNLTVVAVNALYWERNAEPEDLGEEKS